MFSKASINWYFGLGLRWKLTELHFWFVMLGNTVLFITSRECWLSLLHNLQRCSLMQKPQWFLYQIKQVMTGLPLHSKTIKRRHFSCHNRNLGRAKRITKCREKLVGNGQGNLCAWEDIIHGEIWKDLYTSLYAENCCCNNKSSARFLHWAPMPKGQDFGASLLSYPSLKQTYEKRTASLQPFLILYISG